MIEYKIIELLVVLYKLNNEDIEKFKDIIKWFTDQEKKDLLLVLWQRVKDEKIIFWKIFKKIKLFWNKLEEIETKISAEKLLSNL